ncbi:MCE family protein [Candidatus Dependentiae bacterium]|nr:MCE family protein [Candidatus Dependentiae bacterium]
MQIKAETIVGIFILTALGIFFYLSFFLGVFRFDRLKYNQYIVYFSDVSGMEKKADVKIAGVKVGWIEKIELAANTHFQACATIMVQKDFILYRDAHAIVRQDGILGTKYLDIFPGDADQARLFPGDILGVPGRSPVSVDDILVRMRDIATDVQQVTRSLRETFGGTQSSDELRGMFRNFQEAAERIASISQVLDRTLIGNEQNLNGILGDLREFTHGLRDKFPDLQSSIAHTSQTIDRDVSRLADRFEAAAQALEDAAFQARDGFKNVSSVAGKLDEGKGLLGKLINEDETYRDLKVTIQGVKSYFNKMDAVNVVLDSHSEFMFRPAEHVYFEDAKGYFDARFHVTEDKFYVLQIVGSQKGKLHRQIVTKQWFDENGKLLLPSELLAEKVAIPELIGVIETTNRSLDIYKFGFQFGKIFKDVAFRMGIFENTIGIGLDIDIPFGCPDTFRWVTTFEAFDFRGRDRLNDSRPHLKWLNRVFFMRNIYLTFGADDFVSRQNANAFFGGGIRFCDDDIKFLLGTVGFGGLNR